MRTPRMYFHSRFSTSARVAALIIPRIGNDANRSGAARTEPSFPFLKFLYGLLTFRMILLALATHRNGCGLLLPLPFPRGSSWGVRYGVGPQALRPRPRFHTASSTATPSAKRWTGFAPERGCQFPQPHQERC